MYIHVLWLYYVLIQFYTNIIYDGDNTLKILQKKKLVAQYTN